MCSFRHADHLMGGWTRTLWWGAEQQKGAECFAKVFISRVVVKRTECWTFLFCSTIPYSIRIAESALATIVNVWASNTALCLFYFMVVRCFAHSQANTFWVLRFRWRKKPLKLLYKYILVARNGYFRFGCSMLLIRVLVALYGCTQTRQKHTHTHTHTNAGRQFNRHNELNLIFLVLVFSFSLSPSSFAIRMSGEMYRYIYIYFPLNGYVCESFVNRHRNPIPLSTQLVSRSTSASHIRIAQAHFVI